MTYLLTLLLKAGVLFVGIIVLFSLILASVGLLSGMADALVDIVKPRNEDE